MRTTLRTLAVLILAAGALSMNPAADQGGGQLFASRIRWLSTSGPIDLAGSGSPEAAVTAPVGSVYRRTNGGTGTTIYIKESGSGNTGWQPVSVSFGGDVTATSTFGTDNRVLRSDGTGKGAQASGWTVDDSDIGTGIKIDAEGSGNTLTIPSLFIFPWAACQAGTASLTFSFIANAPTAGCITGTNTVWPIATFPDADGEYGAQFHMPIPADFVGAVDAFGKWRAAATSGDMVVQFRWACTADAETANDTWSSASTTTDTAKGTTLQWNIWSITGVTLTGCAADESYVGNVFRQRTHGSDSLTGTFDMVEAVRFVFRRGM